MGPSVFFHCARLSIVIPSTKHPPGQRTNAGLSEAIMFARSGRRPLGRFLKVLAGKSETKSSQTVPLEPNVSTNCALGSEPVAVNLASYLRQVSPVTVLKTLVASTLPSLLLREAVTGPLKA